MTISIPQYSKDELTAYSNQQLIEKMIEDEDRVPRILIDECVSRGEKILEVLASVKVNNVETNGEWWMILHSIMILGLIPSEEAGMLLIAFIDDMCKEPDDDLQDWLAGYWPALTRNKPTTVIEQILTRCEDKTVPWYLRTNITDIVIDAAYRTSKDKLEKSLDWLAKMVMDEDDDWDYRITTANSLLDFPRERHLALLKDMAKRQNGFGVHFNQKDINFAYTSNNNKPNWEHRNNPWEFYEEKKIIRRQQRWQKEAIAQENIDLSIDEEKANDFNYYEQQPYQRDEPKIGRNEPCPCGSGKKYKKCCMH